MGFRNFMKQARDAIIRPRRKEYDLESIPLTLVYESHTFVRMPLLYENKRKQKLVGSLYYLKEKPPNPGDSCVIYLHGNSSSQLEGRFLVPNFCPRGVSVFCFDFAGCGKSGGDFISLGYYESMDTSFIINSLRQQFGFSKFALWGRSMGAATAIITCNKYAVVKIADSSYTSIDSMVNSVAETTEIPSIFRPFACWFIKNSVDSAADFDFSNVSPLEAIKKDSKPIVIGHSKEDKIVPFQQGLDLYKACSNMVKLFMPLPGGHNSQRPLEWIKLCVCFCIQHLGIETNDDIPIYECRQLQMSDAHFSTSSDIFSNDQGKRKRGRPDDSEDGDDGVRTRRRSFSDSDD